jgi:hypothetical protein
VHFGSISEQKIAICSANQARLTESGAEWIRAYPCPVEVAISNVVQLTHKAAEVQKEVVGAFKLADYRSQWIYGA